MSTAKQSTSKTQRADSTGKISGLFTSTNDWIWPNPDQPGSPNKAIAFVRRFLQVVLAIFRELRDGDLSMRAMSLVYTTVIAIVPLIAIVFSVLKGFGMHEQVEPTLLDALSDLGDKRYDIVSNVMSFIDNVNVGVLGSIGFAILLFSVISMMQKIEKAFNATWKINRGRQLADRLRDYLSVIFAGPLLIFLSAAITTSFHTSTVYEYFSNLPGSAWLLVILGKMLPYIMMMLGFALLYLVLPNTKVRWGAALAGGLTTAIIWKTMGWAVSQFIANSASSVAIYSAFASVIILMVWMQLAWLVLLIGASVAFYVQNPDQLRVSKSHAILSSADKEKLALSILLSIAREFRGESAIKSIDELRMDLGVDNAILYDVIDELKALDYLALSEEGDLLLRKAPETINIENLFKRIRTGEAYGNQLASISLGDDISSLFSENGQLYTNPQHSQSITLKYLLDS